jgi:ferritin-like metal-binding protein YciE
LAQEHGDEDEVKRLLKRLDKERAAFHKLYEHTPKPVEVAHAEVIE